MTALLGLGTLTACGATDRPDPVPPAPTGTSASAALGDTTTRPVRTEPGLHEATPGDALIAEATKATLSALRR